MLMAKHVGKRGDTLIEVMLAVGIFSMVAVAVVAVMSGGWMSCPAERDSLQNLVNVFEP